MGKKHKKGITTGYMTWREGRLNSDAGTKKKDKHSKKDKEKDVYQSKYPALKTVHLSLSKKDVKDITKIVATPIDVPKKFIEIREECNHAGDLLTPAEYRAMSANYAAYTPMLDVACAVFGEENVSVCAACYDVVLDHKLINADGIRSALATLYLSANKAVSMKRMKDDKVKKLNKLKGDLTDWNKIIEIIDEIDQTIGAAAGSTGTPEAFRPNDVGNTPIIN